MWRIAKEDMMNSTILIWLSKRAKDITEWVAIICFGFADFIIGVLSLWRATPQGDGRQFYYLIGALAISAMTSGLQIIAWKKIKKLRQIKRMSRELKKRRVQPTAGVMDVMDGQWWVTFLAWSIMILDSIIDMGFVPTMTESNITIANMFQKWSDVLIFPANHLSIFTRILMLTVFGLSLFGEPLLESFSSKKEEEVLATLTKQLADSKPLPVGRH